MTKARSLDPPKLATWLLERFSPVLKNAPLAGDLIEAFKQGRSSAWYWRQVFWAILIGLLNLLGQRCGRLVYAVVCGGLISATWWFSIFPMTAHSSALPALSALFAKGFRILWPWSLVYQIAFLTAFQAVFVASALGAYLAFAKILKAQNFLRALMVVVIVLASSNVVLLVVLTMSGIYPTQLVALISTPTIIALLIGMWRANPGSTARPWA